MMSVFLLAVAAAAGVVTWLVARGTIPGSMSLPVTQVEAMEYAARHAAASGVDPDAARRAPGNTDPQDVADPPEGKASDAKAWPTGTLAYVRSDDGATPEPVTSPERVSVGLIGRGPVGTPGTVVPPEAESEGAPEVESVGSPEAEPVGSPDSESVESPQAEPVGSPEVEPVESPEVEQTSGPSQDPEPPEPHEPPARP